MNFSRTSNAVGGFVQRTLRKASLPWKVVRARRPLSTPSTLSKRFARRIPLTEDEADSNLPQASHADQITTGSLPDAYPGSRVSSVQTETIETQDNPPYTDGPSQIILTSDGTKECLALLLTERIVADLNEINEATRRLEIITEKYDKVRREVKVTELNLAHLKANLQAQENEEERIQILQEIEDYEHTLLRDTQAKDSLEKEVRTEELNLRYLQARSQMTFHKLLTDAELVSPPEPDTVANPEEQDGIPSRANSIAPSHSTGSVISLEQLNKQYVLETLEQKEKRVVDLQNAFDDRKGTYERELHEYSQWISEGRTKATRTDFDIDLLQNAGNVARLLDDAENEYESALAEARALDLLETTLDQESNFGDDVDDGYSLSFEAEMRAAPDHDLVDRWNDTVPETESTEQLEREEMDSDSWGAQSVAMSDSFSVLNHSRGRRRIDRWQAICNLQREESDSLRKETMEMLLDESSE